MPAAISEEKAAAIAADYEAGMSWEEMRAKHKVTPATINRIRTKAGLSRGGLPGSRKVKPKPEQASGPEPSTAERSSGLTPASSDGLTEHLLKPAPPKRAAPGANREAVGTVYSCGECGTGWTLDAGEAQVKECPGCGEAFE